MAKNYHVVGINETVRVLRSIDKQIVNDARKDLRTGAKPVADAVKAAIPSEAPLSGMVHNGRTRWNPAGVKVNVKTNFTKRAQVRETYLVAVVAGAPKDYANGAGMFQIADLAGRKRSGKTASGRNLIKVLNERSGRASRYAWPAAERQIPFIEDVVNGTIKNLTITLNERLKER
jgi:hypothetical protein